MGGSRGNVASGSAVWEFEARWTRSSGLSKAGNLWARHSPKLRREVRFTRDVDYWHWLLIEIDPAISAFCEEPVPRNHMDAKMAALADVWLMRTDGAIEFRSVARSDKQVSTTARVLQETFGEGFTHRALSKEEVLSRVTTPKGKNRTLRPCCRCLKPKRRSKTRLEHAFQAAGQITSKMAI